MSGIPVASSADFPADVLVSIATTLAAYDAGVQPDRAAAQNAVVAALDALARVAPGRSVEVRVPPFGAVQVIAGGTHRRGNPRAVVETDPATWLRLVVGRTSWVEAVDSGALHASGERSDLSALLPLIELA